LRIAHHQEAIRVKVRRGAIKMAHVALHRALHGIQHVLPAIRLRVIQQALEHKPYVTDSVHRLGLVTLLGVMNAEVAVRILRL
jgi:uncharacterized protein (UPF0210 family)